MQTKLFSAHTRLVATFATLGALVLAFTGAITLDSDRAGAVTADRSPTVTTADGKVRGVAVDGGYAFRGLPYAAALPPVTCDGSHRSPPPNGGVYATRRSSRPARSSPARPRSPRPAHSRRTPST